jgi:pimeloyl-ACP methyl ester carboxylesterase
LSAPGKSSADPLDPVAFEVAGDGPVLRGDSAGVGPDIILCHGLSATRRYVVHTSRLLPRRGYRLHTYDARGHGESDPAGDGYGYPQMAADLLRVADQEAAAGRIVTGGHSMGCHTAISFALSHPERVSALVLIGPVYLPSLSGEADLARWDERADALENGGAEAFGRAAAEGIQAPEYRETVERLARERAELHRHPEAVAEALRQVPRSRPFGSMDDLARLDVPALVVGTGDAADPGHPFAVAEQYSETLPHATLITEDPGDSPLSWQGGRLSREIAGFLAGQGIDGRSG